MLESGSSKKAIGDNIKKGLACHEKRKQAIAIALKKAGKSNKK